MKNIFQIKHKYAPYTLYVLTHLTYRELSQLTDTLELLHFKILEGDLKNNIAAPELSYLLTKHFNCQEVSRKHWLKASARCRKTFDIYHNGEKHSPKFIRDVCTRIPDGVVVDVARLQKLMEAWYVEYDAKFNIWLDKIEFDRVVSSFIAKVLA